MIFGPSTTTKQIFLEKFLAISSFSDEMKVKELINDIMAEKEVSEEKEEASLISYDGSYQSIININKFIWQFLLP